MIDIAPCRATLNPNRSCNGIDAHTLQVRKIDHQAIIADAKPTTIVPAATHRQQKILFASKIDRPNHIGHIGTAHNQRRMLIDHRIIDGPRLIIALIIGLDQLAA
jgi:hypothetical protein